VRNGILGRKEKETAQERERNSTGKGKKQHRKEKETAQERERDSTGKGKRQHRKEN
jgi:hypothetical protein